LILDVLAGYLRLAEQQLSSSDLYSQAWNFGPDVSQVLTVENLTEKVIDVWGSGRWVIKKSLTAKDELVPYEAQMLRLDPTKAHKLLGWRQVYSLDESINETVHWYCDLNGLLPDQVYAYTVSQINRYIDAAKRQQQPWALQAKILR
jgi:CDP-glucose 4,6-dehydratase